MARLHSSPASSAVAAAVEVEAAVALPDEVIDPRPVFPVSSHWPSQGPAVFRKPLKFSRISRKAKMGRIPPGKVAI